MINSKSILMCFIDKSDFPSHSFVNGVLSDLACETNHVLIFTSNYKIDKKVYKYKKAILFPVLLKRSGLYRFLNLFLVLYYFLYIFFRKRYKLFKFKVFVRNDPIFLLSFFFVPKSIVSIIYQNSFPHEGSEKKSIKQTIATYLLKIACIRVNTLTAVSDLGMNRIERFCPNVENKVVIPLMSDFSTTDASDILTYKSTDELRLVYIGTHHESRNLSLVMKSIVRSLNSGSKFSIDLYGGSNDENEFIIDSVCDIKKHLDEGRICFKGKVPRDLIPTVLPNYHIGLSLIPINKTFIESSPTKISEYMAFGLAVIASSGIPIQDEVVTNSNGGWLVDWDSCAITSFFNEVVDVDSNIINDKRISSLNYVNSNLSYRSVIHDVKFLFDGLS